MEAREEVENLVDGLQQLKAIKQKMEISDFLDQPDGEVFDEDTSDEAEAVIERVMHALVRLEVSPP
jgi:hypothetical protein